MQRTAQGGGCRTFCAGAGGKPARPMLPPRAFVLAGAFEPKLRLRLISVVDEETHLRIANRIDNRLDVPSGTDDEGALAAEQARGAVAGLPGRDVIGQRADPVDVRAHLAEIDRSAKDLERTRMAKRILEEDLEKLGVQGRWQVGVVVVPVEDVEGGRLVAEQVVADPIVPDQIVWAEPGKHARHFVPGHDAFFLRAG